MRKILAIILIVGCVLSLTGWTQLSSNRFRCGTTKYLIRTANAPAGAIPHVHEAFTQLRNATKPDVSFVYGGTTTRSSVEGYVVVSWTDLGPDFIGLTLRTSSWPEDNPYTGARVQLNTRHPSRLAWILHENGHVGGLGHYPFSVMAAQLPLDSGIVNYSADDISGLRTLATQCIDRPSWPTTPGG